MRTTISLDEDLLRQAKQQAALANRSLSAFVADAVREALARRQRSVDPEPVHLVTVKGNLLPGVNYDSFAELNDQAEGLSD
jgi:metal-responsive CopG/Arc/MetJ family transcriptional regulator